MRTVRRTAAAAVLALLAACSAAPTHDPVTDPTTVPDDATAAAPDGGAGEVTPTPVPNDLLAFTGRQLEGGTFDGAAVRGDVVVWFWAPW